jgi:pimeloyl-ACP methyl ester carboxylesterase
MKLGSTRSLALAAALGAALGAALSIQGCAMTPVIEDPEGKPLAGSIASLVEVELNGRREWISLRGKDATAPVLLFLAGGPGGTDLVSTRRALGELEKHFVVVGWDQPGAGKSYYAIAHEDLSLDVYIRDATALIELLRERFAKDRIYLLGESWGSFLGVRVAQAYPSGVAAFFGTGQMVAFKENDRACYELMLGWAKKKGDQAKVEKLERQGPPPYYGSGVSIKLSNFLLDTWAYMRDELGVVPGGDTIGDIMSPEYGLCDKVHFITGLTETLDAFYPKLWEEDLRKSTPALEVPAYFLIGRKDINASIPLFEDYYARLGSPAKEVVWFEASGHNPWSSESAAFVKALLRLSGVD